MKRVLLLLSAVAITACSSSFCGAPCEKRPESAASGRPKEPGEKAPVLVNQYGSVFGHMEIDTMTAAQLKTERSSLEILLALNDKDKEILKVLKEGKLDTTTFDYNDYSTGGSRFNASGKLRRDGAVKDSWRLLPRMISESQNRELIERYRLVRRRLKLLPDPPEKTPEPAAKSDSAAKAAVVVPAAPDSLWSGFYKANGDTLAESPMKFRERAECEAWAQGKDRKSVV